MINLIGNAYNTQHMNTPGQYTNNKSLLNAVPPLTAFNYKTGYHKTASDWNGVPGEKKT